MALSNQVGEPDPREQAAGREDEKRDVNLQALAERILKLLKEEARLERERLGRR